MILRSLFYNFHIFSFSLGFISGFNNHLINIHLTIPRKIPKLAQLYPEYIIIFIIKILGYFGGITRVVIDCEHRRVTAYTQDGTRVVFQGDKHVILPQTVYESRFQGQLTGWLASLTLENEVRPDLDLPRVVYEYEDVFPDELPGLPP